MRKIYNKLFLVALLAMIVSSCNDWLDVRPSDQIKEEFLFETGNGYRAALNGIYRKLSTKDLYGQNLSWGIVDALGEVYNSSIMPSEAGGTAMRRASERVFKNTEIVPTTDAMWDAAWNIVSNCNNLVQQVEKADTTLFYFGQTERNMIFAEAIALRAFMQFDLLRLYAPAPATNPGDRTFIPYIQEYPAYVNDKQTVAYCIEHAIDDLKKAQEVLQPIDEAISFSVNGRLTFIAPGQDRFVRERGYRLNYYAITALLARVYLYAGNTEMAYTEAMKVVNFQKKNKYFNFTYEEDIIYNGNKKLYDDIIFTLYATDLPDWDTMINYASESSSEYEQTYLSWHPDRVTDIFGSEALSDYRCLYHLEKKYGGYRTLKYRKQDEVTSCGKWGNPMIPMIRMSEVYYIAAETTNDVAEARTFLKQVKSGRGVSVNLNSLDKQALLEMIVNDTQRELSGEGQVFFMFKRLNRQLIKYYGSYSVTKEPVLPTDANFVLPLPDAESNIK